MINCNKRNKATVKQEMLPLDFTIENPSVDIDSYNADSTDINNAVVNYFNTGQDDDSIETTQINHVYTDSPRRKRVAYNNRNNFSENVQTDEELKQEDAEKSQFILNEVSGKYVAFLHKNQTIKPSIYQVKTLYQIIWITIISAKPAIKR